jgi:hypothetical protein
LSALPARVVLTEQDPAQLLHLGFGQLKLVVVVHGKPQKKSNMRAASLRRKPHEKRG